jgi:hypothetical protein
MTEPVVAFCDALSEGDVMAFVPELVVLDGLGAVLSVERHDRLPHGPVGASDSRPVPSTLGNFLADNQLALPGFDGDGISGLDHSEVLLHGGVIVLDGVGASCRGGEVDSPNSCLFVLALEALQGLADWQCVFQSEDETGLSEIYTMGCSCGIQRYNDVKTVCP